MIKTVNKGAILLNTSLAEPISSEPRSNSHFCSFLILLHLKVINYGVVCHDSRRARRLILARTRTAGVVSTQALAAELGVSELTVRRDLKSMADEGLLVEPVAALRWKIPWFESSATWRRRRRPTKRKLRSPSWHRFRRGRRLDHLGARYHYVGVGQPDQAHARLTVVTNSLLVIDALMNVSNIQVEATRVPCGAPAGRWSVRSRRKASAHFVSTRSSFRGMESLGLVG